MKFSWIYLALAATAIAEEDERGQKVKNTLRKFSFCSKAFRRYKWNSIQNFYITIWLWFIVIFNFRVQTLAKAFNCRLRASNVKIRRRKKTVAKSAKFCARALWKRFTATKMVGATKKENLSTSRKYARNKTTAFKTPL